MGETTRPYGFYTRLISFLITHFSLLIPHSQLLTPLFFGKMDENRPSYYAKMHKM